MEMTEGVTHYKTAMTSLHQIRFMSLNSKIHISPKAGDGICLCQLSHQKMTSQISAVTLGEAALAWVRTACKYVYDSGTVLFAGLNR